ncbi:helix-turn-helix transcriptional regulator [Antrihabitans sp. YC2-6]|uniref:helix-turn-helix transcriptional regulator n=1 Tax=Antrihabitans sp. YC2-6 TaxID=2799498 RepID=UPI0018F5A2DF|nr:helix-turn-helix transcriptional regulator [Antrihabitans sp. YC2-6]MBJ8343478.1 helix-turn-helix transcriptional regulator [Antrihabitans sp. YC2-6]
MGVVEDLLQARDAYERREWLQAYDALSRLGDDGSADGADLVKLATAAYLTGRKNDCVQALQRAYQLHVDAGDALAAIRCAFWLATVLATTGEPAIGGGWAARGQRLLDDVPDDVVERGYLRIPVMFQHIAAGEFGAAQEHAIEVADYGRRFGDPDLLAMGISAQGRFAMYSGRVPEGLALMDEAMVYIATGRVSPIFAGQVYCAMIEGCQEVSDFGRAAEWTVALTTWCDGQPGLISFTGQCAVHRGQIMRLRGAFDAALEEFARAVQRYVAADTLAAAGLALAERGDVFRVRGEYAAADAAYNEALGYGHEPQPGLALLWLALGREGAAVAAIKRLLAEVRDPVHRSQLLPAAIEILIAGGETDLAAEASKELSEIAAGFGCVALRAMTNAAAGHLALARGDHADATPQLRRACRLWNELAAPYEAARCAVLLARALRALGDEDSAIVELRSAKQTFAALGAAPDARDVAALLDPCLPGGLSSREAEVLRLVAVGKTNPDIAATLFLSEKTVARHLSNIFTKIGVTSRTAAAAFAFEHRLVHPADR